MSGVNVTSTGVLDRHAERLDRRVRRLRHEARDVALVDLGRDRGTLGGGGRLRFLDLGLLRIETARPAEQATFGVDALPSAAVRVRGRRRFSGLLRGVRVGGNTRLRVIR
jgi:hypothetical protein